nr:reverse transcriptase domain-containing protein [Tanacetum cinerariifolium]
MGRQDPHNHLRFFNKVTSTFRYLKVPNTTIKLLLFPFSLKGEARIWLDKEPSRSILTWEDLVLKFINQFFPPSKTTYLRNEIINFLQKPNKTCNEAWERFKDLLRQCPYHGFSELHQFDTFYNALNTNDQDALDSAAGEKFLDKIPSQKHYIITLPPRKRFCVALDDEIRRDPKREVGYRITDTWDEMLVGMPRASTTNKTELGRRMTDVVTTVRQDTDEIYKMAPKRNTRSTPATATTTTTTMTNAQLKERINQGIANALAARDADRSRNGKDNHDSRMGARRQAPPAHECTYQDFMKCKPLYFKGTKGVVELTQWMFPEESNKIERNIGGLPDMIHGSVMASKLKTM